MIRIRHDISLARRIRYRIGGRARYFCAAQDAAAVEEAISWALAGKIPFFFLGSGTNLLFSDRGFDGLVIQYCVAEIREEPDGIRLGAGTPMAAAVDFFAARGLGDLAWAGGLPGTVGGAVFGNAGCFGGEMKDSILTVESISFDRSTGLIERRIRRADACRFGYRDSIFKKPGGEIVTAVVLRATPGDPAAVWAEVRARIAYRERFHPLNFPSAGNTFKNIPLAAAPVEVRQEFADVVKVDPFPIIPVAAIFDRLGLKGRRIGGAEISARHPNFFINREKATFADVSGLIALAKTMVQERYGILLEEEIRVIRG